MLLITPLNGVSSDLRTQYIVIEAWIVYMSIPISPSLPWLLDFVQSSFSDDLVGAATQIVARLCEQAEVRAAGIFWLGDTPATPPLLLAEHAIDVHTSTVAVARALSDGDALVWAGDMDTGYILPLRTNRQTLGALVLKLVAPPAEAVLWQIVAAHSALVLRQAVIHAAISESASEWDDFISHAVHEIKNPLASAKGYADLLLRRANKEANETYRKGLAVITQQVTRATSLLEQLSDTSRVATNRLHIQRQPADLAALVRRVAQAQQIKTEQHSIQVSGADEALYGSFDEMRISQVVDAMIANAVRFSPHGGAIRLQLEHYTNADGASEALFSVQDQGIGVPEGEQVRVFGRFKRGSNVEGMYSGLGLGLFIAQYLAQQHQGRIWLESAAEQGTTSFLVLPL
jgi:signal transduction histidine kinase